VELLKKFSNKKNILLGLLSIGIIGLIIFTYGFINNYLIEERMEKTMSKINSSDFGDAVYDELESEGLPQPTGMVIEVPREGKKNVVMSFTNFSGSQEQLKNQINKIVKKLSKQNQLGDFTIRIDVNKSNLVS
jgi:hypothetical protein